MLVLIKVGDYLTYKYVGNIDYLKKEFSEYTPDFEIITIRDEDSLFYFEAIPKLIPEQYIYKNGWLHDNPEIRGIFQNYKRKSGEYTKLEVEVEVKGYLRRKVNELLPDNNWGSSRMRDMLGQDLRSMSFEINTNIVNINNEHNIQIHCKVFPRWGKAEIAPGFEVSFIDSDPVSMDPLLREARKYMTLLEELGCRVNISKGLKESLRKDFCSMVLEKKNPYIIKEGDLIKIDEEKARSYGEAQRIILEYFSGVGGNKKEN